MPKRTLPTPPPKLSAKARTLWTETLKTYDLGPHEVVILENACYELTLIERLQEAIEKLPDLMVEGSEGQPVISKMVQEIRMHRAEFSRQIKALELPSEDGPVSRSVSARAAANSRWRMA